MAFDTRLRVARRVPDAARVRPRSYELGVNDGDSSCGVRPADDTYVSNLAFKIAPDPVAPVAAVDVLLDAAISARADFVWIEPLAETHYVISVERDGRVITTATIEVAFATAIIARLAFVCGVDLTAPHAVTGSTRVRARDAERELVFTLRPGSELRAELMFVNRGPRFALARDRYDDLERGDRVDHYRVIARLDAGGMGSVYQAEHAALGRPCAIKVLHGSVLQRDANSIDRFLREARAAARIKHPNIVDVFDFGYLADGRPYFAMELLAGSSLGAVIDSGALAPAQAVMFARQLCEALAVAHDHGVIHADVTPSNVFVITDDRVKLVDFGLAELRDSRSEVASDFVLGTPCYISPEQIRGLPADERSDQYSLGIVLFEMVTGKTPFYDSDVRALCLKHLHEPVPDLHSKFGALPEELHRIINRCLAKSPAARYSSMRALLMDLDEAAKLVERRGWRRWLAT